MSNCFIALQSKSLTLKNNSCLHDRTKNSFANINYYHHLQKVLVLWLFPNKKHNLRKR